MANPLKKTMGDTQSARYGMDALQNHVATLNGYKWVRQSGRPYYIASRMDDNGVVTHYLDRKGA